MSARWIHSNVERFLEGLYGLPLHDDLAVDVSDEDGYLRIEMNVAGIDPKNLEITVENRYLKIKGSRVEEKEAHDKHFYKKEIRRGSFEKVVELPMQIDDSQAQVEMRNGLLRIRVPKKTESESERRIKIKS